jgi:tRNA (guanine-N7-)-methyltransferase
LCFLTLPPCAVNLSALFPEKMILGMEIRDRVVDYVQKRIAKLRKDNPGTATGAPTPRTITPGGRYRP